MNRLADILFGRVPYQPPKESTMSNPDQPTLDDVCTSIAEAQTISEAVRLTLSAVHQSGHRGADERLAEELLERIYAEHDLSVARDRDAETQRLLRQEDRYDADQAFVERRSALEIAAQHHRELNEKPYDGTLPSVPDLFRTFHDLLAGVEEKDVPTDRRGTEKFSRRP